MTLEELQQRFLEGLQHRLTDLTQLLVGSADPDLLMRMFHSLAGIGGTYGFHGVTDMSRSCENLCLKATYEQRPLTAAEVHQLEEAIVGIRAAGSPDRPESGRPVES
jgi:chemotaxis protein histidine kinase CheA